MHLGFGHSTHCQLTGYVYAHTSLIFQNLKVQELQDALMLYLYCNHLCVQEGFDSLIHIFLIPFIIIIVIVHLLDQQKLFRGTASSGSDSPESEQLSTFCGLEPSCPLIYLVRQNVGEAKECWRFGNSYQVLGSLA